MRVLRILSLKNKGEPAFADSFFNFLLKKDGFSLDREKKIDYIYVSPHYRPRREMYDVVKSVFVVSISFAWPAALLPRDTCRNGVIGSAVAS